MFVQYHQTRTVDDNHVRILFKEILTHVVNTMSNSFFKCMDLLERVSTKELMHKCRFETNSRHMPYKLKVKLISEMCVIN